MRRDSVIPGMVLWNTPPQDHAGIHAALRAAFVTGVPHQVIADGPYAAPSSGMPLLVGIGMVELLALQPE